MRKKGVTLIELIAVIAIMGVVFTIIYSIYSNSQHIYNTSFSKVQIQNSARKSLNEICVSIKNSQAATIVKLSKNNIVVNTSAFPPIPNLTTTLLYINPNDSSIQPYLLVIENQTELHKFYTSGKDELISNNIDISNTLITKPLSSQDSYFIKLGVKYGDFSESYTTYSNINSGG